MNIGVKAITRSTSTYVIAALTLLFVFVALTPTPAQAASSRTLSYEKTFDNTGKTSRELAYDAKRHRILMTEDNPDNKPGTLTWFDTETKTMHSSSISLEHAQPEHVVIDSERDRLYILHYKAQAMSVVDLASEKLIKTITGLPKFPAGITLNSDTGNVYVFKSDITEIDPETAGVKPAVKISNEKYPSIKDAVYDTNNKVLWIAEGRKSLITAFDTTTGTWKQNVSIPIEGFKYNNAALIGQATGLALDPALHSLYVAVTPRSTNPAPETKLITINTATGKHIGEPIQLGDTIRKMIVHPSTHELYVSAAFDNKVQLVDPSTWKVTQEVDFTSLGLTKGTGSGNSDTWGMVLDSESSKLYVGHPYTNRLSELTITGTVDTPTIRPQAPNQNGEDQSDTQSAVWEGPAAPSLKKPNSSAAEVADGTLTWGVSEYAQGWEQVGLGENVTVDKVNHTFKFSNGKGWKNPGNGTTQVAWAGGFSLRPYATLVPSIRFLMGNPVLTLNKDGSGSMVMDVATVDEHNKRSGYKRLTVATFAPGSLEAKVTGTTVSVMGKPEYANNSWPKEFVEFIPKSMQPWWYRTGASMDGYKPPAVVSAQFTQSDASDSTPSSSSSVLPILLPLLGLPIAGAVLGQVAPGSVSGAVPNSTPSSMSGSTPEVKSDAKPSEHSIGKPAGKPAGKQTGKQGAAPQASQKGDKLAKTGAELLQLGAIALALMIVGVGILLLQRRRG